MKQAGKAKGQLGILFLGPQGMHPLSDGASLVWKGVGIDLALPASKQTVDMPTNR